MLTNGGRRGVRQRDDVDGIGGEDQRIGPDLADREQHQGPWPAPVRNPSTDAGNRKRSKPGRLLISATGRSQLRAWACCSSASRSAASLSRTPVWPVMRWRRRPGPFRPRPTVGAPGPPGSAGEKPSWGAAGSRGPTSRSRTATPTSNPTVPQPSGPDRSVRRAARRQQGPLWPRDPAPHGPPQGRLVSR
jgi:hypothetical protein